MTMLLSMMWLTQMMWHVDDLVLLLTKKRRGSPPPPRRAGTDSDNIPASTSRHDERNIERLVDLTSEHPVAERGVRGTGAVAAAQRLHCDTDCTQRSSIRLYHRPGNGGRQRRVHRCHWHPWHYSLTAAMIYAGLQRGYHLS